MTKLLEAECIAGIVKVDGLPLPDTVVLGAGVGESSGIVIMEGEDRAYIPETAPDLEDTLTHLSAVISQLVGSLNTIGSTLTAIGAGMTGPTTAPPPTLPASVALLVTDALALNVIKAQLDALKGMLK